MSDAHNTSLVEFTEEDKDISPFLGPEYNASARFAESLLVNFDTNGLKPIVEKAADELRDQIWDAMRDWILDDTEHNVAGAVREMVNQTIDALLTGEDWAQKRYPFANYNRGEKIRAAICEHGGAGLLQSRIADLEAELAKRDETIKYLRRSS